jgi:hypothetical protein
MDFYPQNARGMKIARQRRRLDNAAKNAPIWPPSLLPKKDDPPSDGPASEQPAADSVEST